MYFAFIDQVHPICLPTAPEMRSSTFEGEKPFVAGWGSTQFSKIQIIGQFEVFEVLKV